MDFVDQDREQVDYKRVLKEKDDYIDYLEKLTVAQSNVLFLSDIERKNADKTIKAYEELQRLAEHELKEKDTVIKAHENLMNLSSFELSQKNSVFHNILEINQFISTIIEEEVILKKTIENLMKALGFGRGILFLRENGKVFPKLYFNITSEDTKKPIFERSQRAINRALAEKKTVVLKNESIRNGGPPELISILCLPLLAKEKLLGVIYADTLGGECRFSERDLEIAEIFGTQALISINNVILYRMLKQESITDQFTGLPNRRQLEISAEMPGKKLLALINIDSFSSINTAYGLEAGNHVLRTVALRLKMILPEKSKLYRLSGDEFVILSHDDDVTPHMLASAVTNALSGSPIPFQEFSINVSVSIGLVQNEDNNLLRKADIALKLAKKRGHGYFELYRSEDDFVNRYQQVFLWVNKVKEAVQKDQLIPYFQGIRDNRTGKIEKYECLVRLIDNGEVLNPHKFLGPAKQVGIYSNISFVMIDKCFGFFKDKTCDFSLNLSFEDFSNVGLLSYIENRIRELSIDPRRIIFEVLEEFSRKRDDLSFEFVKALKNLGVKIAIDDFGSEYSNFSRLLAIQADYVKISGDFTKNILVDEQNYKVVKAITDFAHSIGTEVIAEYVCHEDIQKKILELGIEYSQGNLFSRPAPELVKG
ncbi:MAG: sensor domain-containing phosphodiesterase [Spirochaetales bacterium]|nr:sensor domain-containing phosphodiesterase [Spirochaetales bacterium]